MKFVKSLTGVKRTHHVFFSVYTRYHFITQTPTPDNGRKINQTKGRRKNKWEKDRKHEMKNLPTKWNVKFLNEKLWKHTINKFLENFTDIKWNFSLSVYKLKRIKTFFTGLRNEQISNERRVYICVFWKKIFLLSSCCIFSNLTYIRILIGTILCRKRTYIEHEKVYKRHTFGKYIHKERILPPATLFKFYVKISFTYFFLLLFFFWLLSRERTH